jgi:Protein of unknown function (DUF2795)
VDFLRKRLPAQVGRYLRGVEFPARKGELLGRLERNGVPGPVLGQLRKRGSQKASTAAPRMSCRRCEGAALAYRRRRLQPSRAFHGRTS